MLDVVNHPHASTLFTGLRQMSLLPPAFGGESEIAVFVAPYPGIQMAFAVESVPKRQSDPATRHIKFLVSAPDGQLARLTSKQYSVASDDLDSMWRYVRFGLNHARNQPLPTVRDWSLALPHDCLKSLADIRTWIRDETVLEGLSVSGQEPRLDTADAAEFRTATNLDASLRARLFANWMDEFLQLAIDKVTYELATARRYLGISKIRWLMAEAQFQGRESIRNMASAIRTETLAILDLCTQAAGRPLLDAILRGDSLPALKMHAFGIDRGMHRRSVVGPSVRNHTEISAPADFRERAFITLPNLPISGRSYLASVTYLKHVPDCLWPGSQDKWCELLHFVGQLSKLGIDDRVSQHLVHWLLDGELSQPVPFLDQFLVFCQAVCDAAERITGKPLDLSDAGAEVLLLLAEKGLECGPEVLASPDCGCMLPIVSKVCAIPLSDLTQPLFEFPSIPEEFDCGNFVLRTLNLRACMAHGVAVSQCIQRADMAIHYASRGYALYAVNHSSGSPLGTIALALDGGDAHVDSVGVFQGL